MSGARPDYMASYRAVNAKLKRRFMRKPNLGEAAEQFRSLANALTRDGTQQYAAFCSLAAARCEAAMSNPTAEAERYLQAGQQFMAAEVAMEHLQAPGFQEDLSEAIHCYNLAIEIYRRVKRSAYAATLYLELASALLVFQRMDHALVCFVKAASLLKESPLAAIKALQGALECQALKEDYHACLETISLIVDVVSSASSNDHGSEGGADFLLELGLELPVGTYRDIVAESEVTALTVLLLMPSEKRRTETAFQGLLARYRTTTLDNPTPYVADDVFFLLQSAILSVEGFDEEEFRRAEGHIWAHLTAFQAELMHRVPKRMLP